MESDPIYRVVALFAATLAATPAFAGRPLTTDDAAVLEDKRCQVEAWVDRGRDASIGWFVPSCNFGAGVEWQAGFARVREQGEYGPTQMYAQAKTLLRHAREDSPWSVGVTVGAIRAQSEEHTGWGHPYVLLPASITLDAFTIHLQPGWGRAREPHQNLFVWGVAAEWAASERMALLAETFGEGSDKPFVRAGFRWTAIKEHLDLDLTYVARPGGTRDERVVSLGFTWQSARFLP